MNGWEAAKGVIRGRSTSSKGVIYPRVYPVAQQPFQESHVHLSLQPIRPEGRSPRIVGNDTGEPGPRGAVSPSIRIQRMDRQPSPESGRRHPVPDSPYLPHKIFPARRGTTRSPISPNHTGTWVHVPLYRRFTEARWLIKWNEGETKEHLLFPRFGASSWNAHKPSRNCTSMITAIGRRGTFLTISPASTWESLCLWQAVTFTIISLRCWTHEIWKFGTALLHGYGYSRSGDSMLSLKWSSSLGCGCQDPRRKTPLILFPRTFSPISAPLSDRPHSIYPGSQNQCLLLTVAFTMLAFIKLTCQLANGKGVNG